MHLYSLLKSSSLEVVLSKRFVTILYGIMGLAIMVSMAATYLQFVNAYFGLGEFDVTIEVFFAITLGFFLPFWITGALMLRAIIQRIRLAIWAKKAFRITYFDTKFTPASAGMLIDYEYNRKELYATLLELHYRGIIDLAFGNDGLQLTLLKHPRTAGSRYEEVLLQEIFGNDSFHRFSSLDSPRLIRSGEKAHHYLIDDLQSAGVLKTEKEPTRALRILFRFMYFVAGLTGLIYVAGLLFAYQEVTSIVYPREAVDPSQLWLLGTILFLVVGTILSGFWPHFQSDVKNKHFLGWIEAAGFMWYLRTVFVHRFANDRLHTQDAKTIRKYYPYALAYGVVPVTEQTITNAVRYTSSQ